MAINAFEAKLRQVQPDAKDVSPVVGRSYKIASGLCPEQHCEWFQTGRHCVLPRCFKKALSKQKEAQEDAGENAEENITDAEVLESQP